MGIGDAAKDAVGKAKEAVGDAINNDKLERQGEIDQTDAKVGKATDKVKDTAHDLGNKAEHLGDKVSDTVDDVKDDIDRKF